MIEAFVSILLEFLDASPDPTGSNLSSLRFRTNPNSSGRNVFKHSLSDPDRRLLDGLAFPS
jgi:hypothetical protein